MSIAESVLAGDVNDLVVKGVTNRTDLLKPVLRRCKESMRVTVRRVSPRAAVPKAVESSHCGIGCKSAQSMPTRLMNTHRILVGM